MAVLFHRLRRLYGAAIAFAAVLLFASFPSARWHTRMVMSDMLTLLLCTLSAFALIDFVSTQRTRDLLAVFLWAFLAALTKENALHLAILVPCVLGFAVGRPLFRHPQHRFIVLSVITAVSGLAVFRLFYGSNLHGYQDLAQLAREMTHGNVGGSVFVAYSDVASSAVILIAAAGLIAGHLSSDSARKTHVMVSLTWLLSIFAFFLVTPAPADVRYFMPALIPLTLLVAQALYESHERLRPASRVASVVLPAAIRFAAVYFHP
jgi:4-amino-4-deoxy-L-arabinose transferase-like glycosyltransferase